MAHPVPSPRNTPPRSGEPEPRDLAHNEAHIPSGEPWLRLLVASVVPILLGLVLPRVFLMPLLGLSAALFVIAIVVLSRQSRSAGHDRK